MTLYRLVFDKRADKEFSKLGSAIKRQLQKKLAERLHSPRVQADALTGMKDCYKIKLRSVGYRLIYQVKDEIVTVLVIAIAQRDSSKEDSYDIAKRRLI